MAKLPLSAHYFTYKEYGSDEFIDPIQCSELNTIDNGNGTFTITPNVNVNIGDFKILINGTIPYVSNDNLIFNTTGVPRIDIIINNTSDINKITKVDAEMSITNNNGSIYDNNNLYNGNIKIKWRGNSTFNSPKKPYSIDLVNINGDDNDTALLGMAGSSDWILLAEYFDYTLLKNKLVFSIGNSLGQTTWTPNCKYVEVFMNNEYLGVFQLCEKIKRASNRVNVPKLAVTDTSLPKISGGYLLEQVYDSQEDLTASVFFKTTETELCPLPYFGAAPHSQRIEYPKIEDINTQQIDYITGYVQGFEYALFNIPFSNLETGYRNFIDIPCAVDFYLIKELSKSIDSTSHSLWYNKPRDGKIKFGPVWDFDSSMGNIMYAGSPDGLLMSENPWFKKLLEDEYFLDQVKLRYVNFRAVTLNQLSEFVKNSKHLIFTGSSTRNFELWDILSQSLSFNDYPPPGTYVGEIERITNFITNRILFLDTCYGS